MYRLQGDRLEEFAFIQLKKPYKFILVWLANRLFVADFDEDKNSDAVIQLEVKGKLLERRRELIATSDGININR